MTIDDEPISTGIYTVVVGLAEHVDGSVEQHRVTEVVESIDTHGTVEPRRSGDGGPSLHVSLASEAAAQSAREQIAALDGVLSAFVKPPDALP